MKVPAVVPLIAPPMSSELYDAMDKEGKDIASDIGIRVGGNILLFSWMAVVHNATSDIACFASFVSTILCSLGMYLYLHGSIFLIGWR